MEYLLLLYEDERKWQEATETDRAAIMEAYYTYTNSLQEAGVFKGGNALQPVATATTVRRRNRERMTTDGPFAETKEQLGGYYLIDCANLDEALDWAAKIPAAETGCVEVRPVMVFE